MTQSDIRKTLNKKVLYKGSEYLFTAAIIRKKENTEFYQAELLDLRSGNSVIICKLEEVEVLQ